MPTRTWFRKLIAGSVPRKTLKSPRRGRLTLVAMEERYCPATFTVVNTAGDTSVGSLRWAVLQANALSGDDTVVFDSLFSTPQTIALAGWSVQPDEPYVLTKIIGPGSKLLTVSGAGNSRVFTIAPGCDVEISGMTLANGLAYLSEGGGLSNKGFTKLTDCTLTGNAAAYGRGGGNIWNDNLSTLDLINCTIRDNFYSQSSTSIGGGLLNDGTVTMKGCTISGNTSYSDGAGVFNSSTGKLTMTDCTVNENTGSLASGGGVANQGTATLTNCTFSGNYSLFGAVGNSSTGSLTMNFCTVSNSIAGGGIENGGTVTLNSCTISNNIGSGVRNSGTVSLFNSTISGNSVQSDGGGLVSGGPVTMTNCTINGNTASSGKGGGLNITGSSTSTLTNCTIYGNSASSNGGGLYANSTVKLLNVIVANNSAISGFDVSGTITSQGKNLISRTDGSSGFGSSDLTGTNSSPLDPMLAPLGNYGGSTNTMGLLPGSPAINVGTGSGTDQRGKSRVGVTDIGAFESQGFTLTLVSGSSPQSTSAPDGAFANPLALTVTATNTAEPIIGGIVRFTAPTAGASAVLSASSITLSSSPATVSVTATGNGTAGSYVVTATAATGVAASFSLLNRGLPTTYVVNTTSDSMNPGPGLLSLPQAISLAGSDAAVSTITFDSVTFATPRTITRTGTGSLPVWLELRDSFAQDTIIGPAAGVTIHGGGLGQVLQIAAGVTASASGLTITGGNSLVTTTAAGVTLSANAVFTMTNCSVSGNTGTGVLAVPGATSINTLFLTNCTISNNSGGTTAGGLRVQAPGGAVVTSCIISGNTGGNTGGVTAGAIVTLTNCTISGNTGTSNAGGINALGTLVMTNCTVNGNIGGAVGGINASGGINVAGIATLLNCTVSGNSVSTTGTATAGGILAPGVLSLTNCTISGNAGSAGTGGLRGAGTLLNTIVAGNTGTTAADVMSNFVSAAKVVSTGNGGYTSAPAVSFSGGGGTGATGHAAQSGGYVNPVTIDNGGTGYTSPPTIILSGGGGSGAAFTASVLFITSLGNNLIGTIGTSVGWLASDRTGTDASPLDPLLGIIANNGGPVQTIALLVNSPAINAGSNSGTLTTDARGLPRNFGSVDIGAFELQPSSISKLTQNTQTVSDAKIGPEGFSVTATFNMPMNTSVQPVILFPAEMPAGSITFSNGSWIDSTNWIAKFQVADLGTTLNDIDLQISGAIDGVTGLTQQTFTALDAVDLDTQNAVMTSITSTTPDGNYTVGQSVNITLNFSEAATLDGTLNVTLDSGAVVSFAAQSGTSLSGTYTVATGQSSPDLNVTAITLSVGSTLRDIATNASLLTLPISNLAINKAITVGVATPSVTNIVINNGDVQRSRVTSIVVNFSSPVDAATLGSITLTRIGISSLGLDTLGTIVDGSNGLQIAPATGMVSSITLTFANVTTSGIDHASLADGRWQLSLSPNSQIHRLTGDADNNGTVDGADLVAFGNAFGSSVANSPFDFDNNSTVDGADLIIFGNRFGCML